MWSCCFHWQVMFFRFKVKHCSPISTEVREGSLIRVNVLLVYRVSRLSLHTSLHLGTLTPILCPLPEHSSLCPVASLRSSGGTMLPRASISSPGLPRDLFYLLPICPFLRWLTCIPRQVHSHREWPGSPGAMERDPIRLAAQLEPVGGARLEPWDEATSTHHCWRWSLGRRIPASESRSASQPRQPPSLILKPHSRLVKRCSISSLPRYMYRLGTRSVGFR